MSKIKELLNDDKTVLVFDIDGVLALLEFGEYNHFGLLTDEEWNKGCETNNYYTEDKVSKKMQSFISKKNKNNIYIISKVNNENEVFHKKDYANKYYGILKENIYLVRKNSEKVDAINEIRSKHMDIDDYQIVMIDDTVNILTEIEEKTNYSTAHISSFLDI